MRIVPSGVAAMLVAMLACTSGCPDRGSMAKESRPVVRGLSLETVRPVSVPERFEVSGTVKAGKNAPIAARVSGTVSGVHAKEGDRVRQGSLLMTIHAREVLADAAGAEHAAAEALARKKLADVTYERFSRLFEEQAVTRQELDTRRAERDMAERALARAREASRAASAVAGYTRITAPISGVVTSKTVDPGATVFPGMPLMTVEEEGRYRLEVAVPESLLGRVVLGASVPVSLDGVADGAVAKVAEIVPKVDPVSRTFLVKLDIPSPGARSGRFGRALLPVGEKRGILVPKTAVVERGQLTFVWIVDNGNIARMRLVKPGASQGGRVEILAGLSEGERVVTGGTDRVRDGAKVE